MAHKVLRLPATKDKTGLSRSGIYSGVSQGTFPQPIKLGPRAVGWLEDDLEAWIRGRIERGSASGRSLGGR